MRTIVAALLYLSAVFPAAATSLETLHAAIAAACPQVDGVSVGSWTDKSTWTVNYGGRWAPLAGDKADPCGAAVAAGFDPNAPANNPVYVSSAALLKRLTVAEYTGIMQAAAAKLSQGDGSLSMWLDTARTAQGGVNINDPSTQAAKSALVGGGILTQSRADVIFSQ